MAELEHLRLLPPVDQVLQHAHLAPFRASMPRAIVLRVVQAELEALRAGLRQEGAAIADRNAALDQVADAAAIRLRALGQPALRRVLNATGVILHTNLGRAQLSEAAIEAVVRVARGYVDLEYNLKRGERASRMDHVVDLVAALCSAPAAHVVNNNAAAVLLAIHALGKAGVVVSRGELVEIGDNFRLPDILACAGVPIHEIGTTNRTSPADYEQAARLPGCVLLKVHRSNFAVHGFTRDVSVAELAAVAARCQAVVVYDLGAGCLEPWAAPGLAAEPDVQTALAAGADLVTMSGDKLLGGPQAGLLAGKAAPIAAVRRDPLARALRIDKLTLAALQATLLSYLAGEGAGIPTLRLILTKPADIEARARWLLARLENRIAADLEVVAGSSSVGGGSFADAELPSYELRVRAHGVRGNEVLARLRGFEPAVVARIKDETVGFDLRCIGDDELETLAQAVERAVAGGGKPA